MPAHASRTSDDELKTVNLRMRNDIRMLVDWAARLKGRSRTDFIIEACRRAAEETILDQLVVTVDPERHRRFLALLERTPESNERVRKLIMAGQPWTRR